MFIECKGWKGGCLYFQCVNLNDCLSINSQISHSLFENNTASKDGGAIHYNDYWPSLINTTFRSNKNWIG